MPTRFVQIRPTQLELHRHSFTGKGFRVSYSISLLRYHGLKPVDEASLGEEERNLKLEVVVADTTWYRTLAI